MIYRILGIALFLAAMMMIAAGLSSCAPVPVVPVRPADCPEACAKGRELGCRWAENTPMGAPCEAVCESTRRVLPWQTECIAGARTCEEADACQ